MSIGGVNLKLVVATHMARGAQDVTISRRTNGTRGADVSAGTNPDYDDQPCKVRVNDQGARFQIVVYGQNLTIEPHKDDVIILKDGTEYVIEEVQGGSEGSTYLCYTADIED